MTVHFLGEVSLFYADDGGDSGEPPVDDGGVAGGGLSTGQVGFANLVANAEANTVSMDVVLPEGSGGLVALHLDLKGITTDGVNQVIGLNGVAVDDFTTSSSHVVVDNGDLHTNGWNGGPVFTLEFANVPSSYTDGTMTAAEIVSSFIQDSYIDANFGSWGLLNSVGYLGGGDSGEDEYPMGEWSPGDDTDANDSDTGGDSGEDEFPMSEWSPSDDTGDSDTAGSGAGDYPISEWAVTSESLKDMLIADQIVGPASHIEVESSAFEELVEAGVGTGDYAYVDRSFGGAVVYAADGGTSSIDFDG